MTDSPWASAAVQADDQHGRHAGPAREVARQAAAVAAWGADSASDRGADDL
jgi:hypothetical protein